MLIVSAQLTPEAPGAPGPHSPAQSRFPKRLPSHTYFLLKAAATVLTFCGQARLPGLEKRRGVAGLLLDKDRAVAVARQVAGQVWPGCGDQRYMSAVHMGQSQAQGVGRKVGWEGEPQMTSQLLQRAVPGLSLGRERSPGCLLWTGTPCPSPLPGPLEVQWWAGGLSHMCSLSWRMRLDGRD